MTDNEIISAWNTEIQLSQYVDDSYADGIKIGLIKSTIDLINRQKAEIEKAWELFKKQSDENIEMQKLCDKQKAKIEELQRKIMSCNSENDV